MKESTLIDGLKRVFAYHREICPAVSLEEGDCCLYLCTGEKRLPIFGYRAFPKFAEMKNLPLLGDRCALTVSSVAKEPLPRIVFRELDLAEYLLDSPIEHITAYRLKNSVNLIAAMKNGTKAMLQIHSSLYGERQFRHELFTTEGMVSDRVVDTVVAQHSLNIFTADGAEALTDADMLLYGFSPEEQECIYGAYDALHADAEEEIARGERLTTIVHAVLTADGTYRAGRDFE